MRVKPDGSGPDPADGGPDAFRRKIDIIRDEAGDRFARIELGTSVLAGDPARIRDSLRRWRAELGLSFFVLHHETDLDAFTPIVESLAGT